MFIQNKYLFHYFKLVEERTKTPLTEGLIETHHIIPKSIGGSNKPENLVKLTAREHYIAHKLLIKITSGISREKMIHALWGMSNRCINDPKHNYLTSKRYEYARKLFLEIAGSSTRGKTYEEIYGNEKANQLKRNRAENLTKNRKGKTWEQIFGKDKAEWMRQRVSSGSEKRKGKSLSDETKLKIKSSSIGKIYPKICCPVCNKEVGSNNYKRHYASHA